MDNEFHHSGGHARHISPRIWNMNLQICLPKTARYTISKRSIGRNTFTAIGASTQGRAAEKSISKLRPNDEGVYLMYHTMGPEMAIDRLKNRMAKIKIKQRGKTNALFRK